MQDREQQPEEGAGSRVSAAEEGDVRAGDGSDAPFQVSPGGRIRLGYRKGTVESVRGGRGKPYDVRILWDGEKSPVYLVFTSLERDFRAGRLQVLKDTKESAPEGGISGG